MRTAALAERIASLTLGGCEGTVGVSRWLCRGFRAVGAVGMIAAVGLLAAGPAFAGWRYVPVPSPFKHEPSYLQGLSCPSVRMCMAVGVSQRHGSDGPWRTLAERWDGHRWRKVPTPNPPGPVSGSPSQPSLQAASCVSTRFCMAVGSYPSGSFIVGRGQPSDGLAERWDGHRWSIQPVPAPLGAVQTTLVGVSCTSPSACIAVGGSQNPRAVTLTERWNGRFWSIASLVASGGLSGVSCLSMAFCMGAGFGNGPRAADGGFPFAADWTGTGWHTTRRPPNPGDPIENSGFDAVSCSARTSCTAVGSYDDGYTNTFPLAERWNGSRWRVEPVPNMRGSSDTELTGVSCPTRAMCATVGFADRNPPVDVWSDGGWRRQHVQLPAGAQSAALNAVSCLSPRVCTAVGVWTAQNRRGPSTHLLAEETTTTHSKRSRPPARRPPPFTG